MKKYRLELVLRPENLVLAGRPVFHVHGEDCSQWPCLVYHDLGKCLNSLDAVLKAMHRFPGINSRVCDGCKETWGLMRAIPSTSVHR